VTNRVEGNEDLLTRIRAEFREEGLILKEEQTYFMDRALRRR